MFGFELVVLLASTVGGAIAVAIANQQSPKRRLLKEPPTAISEFPDLGTCKIVGTIVEPVGDPVLGPVTRAPCVFCRSMVRQVLENNQRKVVFAETESTDFWLDDGGDRALIQVDGPMVVYAHRDIAVNNARPSSDSKLEAFLERTEHATAGRYDYRETRLEVGDTIAVYGRGAHELRNDPSGYRTKGHYVRLIGARKCRLLITDDPAATGTKL